jgi:hypothetical protein
MKKLITILVTISLVAPMSFAFAQTVDNSNSTIYNSLLQTVINLLVQEVAQLEQQLATLQTQQNSIQAQIGTGIGSPDLNSVSTAIEPTTTYTPSTIVSQLQQTAPQVVQTTTPPVIEPYIAPTPTPPQTDNNKTDINSAFNNCLNSIPLGTLTENGYSGIVTSDTGTAYSNPTTETFPISFRDLLTSRYNSSLTLISNNTGTPEIISNPNLLSYFSTSTQSVTQNYGFSLGEPTFSLDITMPTFPYYCPSSSNFPLGIEIE